MDPQELLPHPDLDPLPGLVTRFLLIGGSIGPPRPLARYYLVALHPNLPTQLQAQASPCGHFEAPFPLHRLRLGREEAMRRCPYFNDD